MHPTKPNTLTRIDGTDEAYKKANEIKLLINDWFVLMKIKETESECRVSLISDRRGSKRDDIMLYKQVLYVLERRLQREIPIQITSNFPSLCSMSEDC